MHSAAAPKRMTKPATKKADGRKKKKKAPTIEIPKDIVTTDPYMNKNIAFPLEGEEKPT